MQNTQQGTHISAIISHHKQSDFMCTLYCPVLHSYASPDTPSRYLHFYDCVIW
jgi:hypothetical protein